MNAAVSIVLLAAVLGVIVFLLSRRENTRRSQYGPAGLSEFRTDLPLDECFDRLDEHRDADEFVYECRREKDGGVKGTLINLTQLSRLQKKMDGILTEMGESLHRGEIGAVPSFGAGYDRVCDWCDYKSVCGYEPGAPVRPIEKLTHAQSLERLEKEETRHG